MRLPLTRSLYGCRSFIKYTAITRPPYFRRYGRELVSKPVISLKKRLRGYRRTTVNYHLMNAWTYRVRHLLSIVEQDAIQKG